jgi:hypothetical protein
LDEEEWENKRLLADEEKRRRTRTTAKSIMHGVYPYRRFYVNQFFPWDKFVNQSIATIFRKSLGPPMPFELRKKDVFQDYSYEGPLTDFIEFGITYPEWTIDAWAEHRYNIDLPANYPEFGYSLIDIDDLTECDHCGKLSLDVWTCEDCGSALCQGCWSDHG